MPQVRHIAAAEEYLLEHLSEDEETLQFLFTPLSGSNTCLAWFLVRDYVRPGGEKAYKYRNTKKIGQCYYTYQWKRA